MATARASSLLTSVWLGDCPCTRTPPVASAGLIQQAGAWTRRGGWQVRQRTPRPGHLPVAVRPVTLPTKGQDGRGEERRFTHR